MSFGNRPLFTFLFSLICGFSLFATAGAPILVAVLLLSVLITAFLFLQKREKLRTFRVPFLAFCIGTLLSLLVFYVVLPISVANESDVTVVGTVVDVETGDSGSVWTMKTETVDGKRKRTHILVFPDGIDESIKLNAAVGDRLTLNGSLTLNVTRKKITDASAFSDGIIAEFYATYPLDAEETGKIPLTYAMKQRQRAVCSWIDGQYDSEVAGLLSALLLGDRSNLSSPLRLAFRRTGTSHLLAISGMHLAILFGFLDRLMRLLGISKKPRKIISIVFCLFYMLLIGFPSSVARAGIMLIFSSLLYLLKHESDSYTTLTISVFLILAIEPFAVLDIGLWLSAFATFGVLYGSDIISSEEKLSDSAFVRLVRKIGSPAFLSFFAIAATAVFSVTVFGEISIVGVLSTPIFGLFVEVFLILGLLFLPFGKVRFIGVILGFLYETFSKFVLRISEFRHLLLPADTLLSKIAALFLLAVLFVGFFANVRNLRAVSAAVIGALIVFYAIGFSEVLIVENRNETVYLSNQNEDGIFLRTDKNTVWIDESGESGYSSYWISKALRGEHLTELDVAVFPNVRSSLPEEISSLASSMKIRSVVIAKPQETYQIIAAGKIKKIAEAYGIEVTYLGEKDTLAIGSVEINFPLETINENFGFSLITIRTNNGVFSYIPNGFFETKTKTAAETIISASDAVIFGCSGYGYSYYHTVEKTEVFPSVVIISDDHVRLSETLLSECRFAYHPKRYVIR